MTNTANALPAITINTDNAFVTGLVQDAEALLTKNAKKNGLEKITATTQDGIARTYPTLINIKPGFNFRDLTTKAARESLMELAASIKEIGIQQPIVIFKEGDLYYAEDGHRRLAALDIAINELGATIKTVPVRLSPKNSNDAERVFSQFVLNTGEKPTALETAGIFGRLIKLGWPVEELRAKSGYSPTRFNQILELNNLPEALKTLMRSSDIEVKPSFVQERFEVNKKDGNKTVREIEEAIANARLSGHDRATNKHLPAGAEIGPSAKRTQMGQAALNAAGAANGSTNGTAPDVVPTRQRVTIQAGTPANVPMPDGAAASGKTNNSELRKALHAFFKELVIEDFHRDGKTVPSFQGGKFMSEAQWITIRDGLGL